MTKRNLTTLLPACIAISMLPLAHASTPVSGPYIRAMGAFSFINDGNISTAGISNSSYKSGYAGGGQLGYKSGPIRYELDGSYIKNNLKGFSLAGTPQTDTSGYSQVFAGLINVFYDFEDLNPSLAPYLGFGVGYAQVKNSINSSTPSTSAYSQSDTVFAYKAQVGLTYNFSENIAADVAYQYFRTKKSNTFNSNYQTNLLAAGVTYRFDN